MTTSTQWQLAREAAERYERILVPTILGPFARALVDRVGLRPGETVADIGCGTGAAARRAAERVGLEGRVIGVDNNAAMLEVASTAPLVAGATIEWREGSALDLPFDDGSLDAVVCAQTLQFLTERERALGEMRRVLKVGGRLGVSVWSALEANPYFHAVVESVARHIGPDVAAGLRAAFALSDTAELRSLLAAAGFEHLWSSAALLELPLPPLEDFVPRHIGATPMAAGFAGASPQTQALVVREIVERLASFSGDDGVRIPFRSHIAIAEKPARPA